MIAERLRGLVRHNLLLKVASLLLAVLLYATLSPGSPGAKRSTAQPALETSAQCTPFAKAQRAP